MQHLGMDYVDLLILHMWDYHTPLSDIMEGLHRQVKAGKVRAVGFPLLCVAADESQRPGKARGMDAVCQHTGPL